MSGFTLPLLHLVMALALTSGTVLGLGVLVALKRRCRTGLVFFFYCLSIAWWSFFEIWHVTASDLAQAVLWARLMEAGAFFIPTLFVHFVTRHLGRPLPRIALPLLYLVSASIAMLCWTPALIAGAEPRWYLHAVFQPGRLYWLAVLYFIGCATYAHYQLYLAYVSATGIPRYQLGYLWFSSLLGYLGGAGNFLLVFGIDVPGLNPFGTYGVLLYVAGTSYAIVKYRLMDITVLVEKGLLSLALFALAAISTYPIVLLAEWTYFGQTSHMVALIMVLLITVALGVGYPIRASTRAAMFRTLFPYRYDRYQIALAFPKSLDRVMDVSAVSQKVTDKFKELMGAHGAALYVLDSAKHGYVMTTTSGTRGHHRVGTVIQADSVIPQHWEHQETGVLVRAELEYEASAHFESLIASMTDSHMEMCIPLRTSDHLLAFCALWGLQDQSLLTDVGDSLLCSLSLQAATKLESALLHEEQKREHQRRMRTDRLRSLDIISAGFAHEVRNPLTSIKTFIQLAPTHSTDVEFITSFSTIAADDVSRIERLITEVLDYARYAEPQLREENLNDLLKASVYFLEVNATQNLVHIHKELHHDLPIVVLDKQQIKQALLNLCINAVQAMSGKGGDLWLRTFPLTKGGQSWVQLEITDTGCGIAPEALEHIFDPFFTTKHESTEREGTGLGLTIVHQIIQEHGGTIEVASQQHGGTTFTIQLPCRPPSSHIGHSITSPSAVLGMQATRE